MWILDTNICIYLIKQRPRAVLDRLQMMDITTLRLSVITVAELEYGAAKSSRPAQNHEALAAFLAPFTVLPFTDAATACYGQIRADLERAGTPIGSMDLLIAAHAVSLEAVLVTNNEREFRRVPTLRIENWV